MSVTKDVALSPRGGEYEYERREKKVCGKIDSQLGVLKRLADTTEWLVSRTTEGLASIGICLPVAPVRLQRCD